MHGSITSQLCGRGGPLKLLICIFRNNLLNIWTTTYDFSLLYAYLYDLKPVAVRMFLGRDLNVAKQRAN